MVDVQLRQTMRIISGTLHSTPGYWLPVLSNIMPPHIRRQQALARLWSRMLNNKALPIHQDIAQTTTRLRSHRPAWKTALQLTFSQFNPKNARRKEWSKLPPHSLVISDPSSKPPGFNLPRSVWMKLNRIRCDTGRSASALYQWGWKVSPCCDGMQTIKHIVQNCPRCAFPGSLENLHEATPEAIAWLAELDIQL